MKCTILGIQHEEESAAFTFATRSYISMAWIHLHKPSAAEEAFATILGSKSGFVMYSERIFCITGTCDMRTEYRLQTVGSWKYFRI